MKLARTYLEMGMLDEATKALQTAARSPLQRFEAGAMLGASVQGTRRSAARDRMVRARGRSAGALRRGRPCAAVRPWPSRSKKRARPRARWRYSSNCRRRPASIAMPVSAPNGWRACRPEVEHLVPHAPPLRRLLPRGRAGPHRGALVRFWERNFFAGALPLLERAASSAFVRGGVSGIGAITALAGLAELAGIFGSTRGTEQQPERNAEV